MQPPRTTALQIRDTPDDVSAKIIQATDDDEDAMDALSLVNKNLRGLVKRIKRGVRIEVTAAMVTANKEAMIATLVAPLTEEDWYKQTFDYPELRPHINTLVQSLSQIEAPRKLTIILYTGMTNHGWMPALPLVITSKFKVVSLKWSSAWRPTHDYIPKILFDPNVYGNMVKLSARDFDMPTLFDFTPNIHTIECQSYVMGSSWSKLNGLHLLRVHLNSDRITELPKQIKSLWIKNTARVPMELSFLKEDNFTFTTTQVLPKAYPLEDLVFVDTIFEPRALIKTVLDGMATVLFANIKRLALIRCSFFDNESYAAFRGLFPANIEFVVSNLSIVDPAIAAAYVAKEDPFVYVPDDELARQTNVSSMFLGGKADGIDFDRFSNANYAYMLFENHVKKATTIPEYTMSPKQVRDLRAKPAAVKALVASLYKPADYRSHGRNNEIQEELRRPAVDDDTLVNFLWRCIGKENRRRWAA